MGRMSEQITVTVELRRDLSEHSETSLKVYEQCSAVFNMCLVGLKSYLLRAL